MKKIISLIITVVLILSSSITVSASTIEYEGFNYFIDDLDVICFIINMDFIQDSIKIETSKEIIEKRNEKLNELNIELYPIDTRINLDEENLTVEYIKNIVIDTIYNISSIEVNYSYEDILYLSKTIAVEAGSDWSDLLQLSVGNVVINRASLKNENFPDTIKEVIEQKGQYSTLDIIKEMNVNDIPNNCIKNAKELLNGVRTLPDYIVYQANFKIGTVYKVIEEKSPWYSFTMYFGY